MWYNKQMALTNQQDIPSKPEVREPWTFKRLFPFVAAVTSFTKVFVNPFDILLGYLVVVLSIAELLSIHVSGLIWTFAVLLLTADLLERNIGSLSKPKEELKK